jgi:hypothetical protein
MAKKQKLNSLDRFRKDPGRLVLEVHGHCEIPAGCGGVVLRWRNPLASMSVLVHLYAPVAARVFLDGTELKETLIDLPSGLHVLAVHLSGVDLGKGFLMFVAQRDDRPSSPAPSRVEEAPLRVLSVADGTWNYTLAEPDEAWTRLGFDSSAWDVLAEAITPHLAYQDFGYHAWYRCREHDAPCLGLPPARPGSRPRTELLAEPRDVWVRKVFEVPAPRERTSDT